MPAAPRRDLLPTVLDRLLEPEDGTAVGTASRPRRMAALRNTVRRDLEALLNTHKRCLSPPAGLSELEPSVVEYGLPDFLAVYAGATTFREEFRRTVEDTIRRYEPRFIKVAVTLVDDGNDIDRTLRFRIDALMQADPAPEPVTYESRLEPATQSFLVGLGRDV
jgi:type VI secretion system protein ImpF